MSRERLRELIFDHYYYAAKVQNILGITVSGTREDLIGHYRTVGWRAGISPSPYFDFDWYYVTHPGLREAGEDPLEHYLDKDYRWASPHPLFDIGWYLQKYVPHGDEECLPVVHYIETGWRKGAQPNSLLWTEWYKKTYGIDTDPFYHFVVSWTSRKFDPNPLFDIEYYCSNLLQTPGPDPLSHYIHVGCHQDCAPHILFDPRYYAQQVGMDGERPEGNLLAHYFEHKKHSPCPLFDTEIYLEEIGARRVYDVPLVDYMENGWKLGARPHGHFSPSFYLRHYDDVKTAGFEPLQHYLRSGWFEGRQPHPLFDASYYSRTYSDVSGNPLIHYLREGWRKGYSPRPPEPVRSTAVRLAEKAAIDVTDLLEPRAQDLPVVPNSQGAPAPPRIGIFVHVYYLDLFEELVGYLNNVPFPCTIFMTTCDPLHAAKIGEIAARRLAHPFQIKPVENRGRDIAPFLVHYRAELKNVEIGAHIHTKKSLHYMSEFVSWRTYLLEHNLGSPELVRRIVALLQSDAIGAVVPSVYAPLEPMINWGGNFETARKLLEEVGERLWPDQPLEFPVGSMFWFKTKALEKLLSLHLDLKHFDPEVGQIDGTLHHAIERTFLYFIEAAGYSWLLLARDKKGAKTTAWLEGLSTARIGGLNRMLIRAREADVVSRYYPECTSFVCTGSASQRPRINLLLPTVDRSLGYAGVATALELFDLLRAKLGPSFDARIVSTDVSPSNQYAPPQGFVLEPVVGTDRDGIDTVVDAAQRYKFPFSVRSKDIFVATAWWTARSAFDILDQQQRLFGTVPGKILYLIQDFECGFHPWSTKYALAQSTYRRPGQTVPIFNTEILRDFFVRAGYYSDGLALAPGVSKAFAGNLERGAEKERNVLLYARPHAERNCLPFVDMLVASLVGSDPSFWRDWRFLAIGETFDASTLRCSDRIEVLGRLSVPDYAKISSKSALAVSLMVSPHPSYPPLEMAGAGVLVLANRYEGRDPSELHENIHSFGDFDIRAVAAQLTQMAQLWTRDRTIGWRGRPKVSWFFDGATNLPELGQVLADVVTDLCAMA